MVINFFIQAMLTLETIIIQVLTILSRPSIGITSNTQVLNIPNILPIPTVLNICRLWSLLNILTTLNIPTNTSSPHTPELGPVTRGWS